MLKIRLSMGGVRKRPIYKIVIADSRAPRDGKFIEKIGSFNPLLPKDHKERISVEAERVKHWVSKGAKPTLRVSRILGEAQIMPMPKAGNNPLKAVPKKKARKKKIWSLEVINIRDYSKDKHKTVDDTPYGGGNGMLMRADIIAEALDKNISKKNKEKI
jgi:small subunit ribosomal protein S16